MSYAAKPTLTLLAVPALLLALPALWNGCFAAPPGDPGPVVVELFTSQGCSSCPPADELLGELAKQPNIIALAFHVDYWDDAGWRDRYSMSEATARQRRYVERLRLPSAFTPQMVIGGSRSFVGSDKQGIAAAIAQAAAGIPIDAAIRQEELTVTLPESPDHANYEVNLVAYFPRATTQIGHGENSGRTLTEYNVVRQVRRLGSWSGKGSTFRLSLNSFPGDANRAAVLVQRTNQGAVVGAVAVNLR